MHVAILIIVAVGALSAGFLLGLVVLGKRADENMARALRERDTCTRPAPHICKVNGPCNGYPKEDNKF